MILKPNFLKIALNISVVPVALLIGLLLSGQSLNWLILGAVTGAYLLFWIVSYAISFRKIYVENKMLVGPFGKFGRKESIPVTRVSAIKVEKNRLIFQFKDKTSLAVRIRDYSINDVAVFIKEFEMLYLDID